MIIKKYPRVIKFEDLVVWQISLKLSARIYEELKQVKNFSLRDQIQRSSVSVFSNIAEGFERKSNKDNIRFLYIAKGSCSELRAQLYLAKEIKLIDDSVFLSLIDDTKKVSAMLHDYIKTRYENFYENTKIDLPVSIFTTAVSSLHSSVSIFPTPSKS